MAAVRLQTRNPVRLFWAKIKGSNNQALFHPWEIGLSTKKLCPCGRGDKAEASKVRLDNPPKRVCEKGYDLWMKRRQELATVLGVQEPMVVDVPG